MARKYTNEQEAIHALITSAPINKDTVRSFDPPATADLDGEEIALKRTESYPVIPKFGAPACIAVFGTEGPGLDQSATENVVRHDCDAGVLVRRPDLTAPEEHIEAIRATQQLGLMPRTAWVVELLVPDPYESGAFAHSGHVKGFIRG